MDEDLFNLHFLGLLPGELPRRDREVNKYIQMNNVAHTHARVSIICMCAWCCVGSVEGGYSGLAAVQFFSCPAGTAR